MGFDLYLRWLEETVRALQGGDAGMAPAPPEVVLDAPARIPDAWVPDDDVKLDLYRRLARATSPGANGRESSASGASLPARASTCTACATTVWSITSSSTANPIVISAVLRDAAASLEVGS